MAYGISAICLIAALYGFEKERFVFNPFSLMFLIWGIITPLSMMGFYGMKHPSERTLWVILIGLIGFFIGTFVGDKDRRYKIKPISYNVERHNGFELNLNYKLLYVLLIIALLYFIRSGFIVSKLLVSGHDFAYIKSLAVDFDNENELRSSLFIITLKNFIAQPVAYLSIAILPLEIFFGKRDKKLIISTIVLAALWIFTTAGRAVIVWTGLYFLVSYFFFRKKNRKKEIVANRNRKVRFIWLAFGAAILVIALFYTTVLRKGADVDIYRQLLIYFVAPITHMDHYLDVVNRTYHNVYGFGLSSFYGFAYPFLFLINLFNNGYPDYISTIRDLSFDMFQETIPLGGTIYMNAYVTIFFQPYVDGRFIGVFFILLLFGFCSGRLFHYANSYNDARCLLLYLLFFQKIADSMVRFYFTQTSQVICFLFAILVTTTISTRNKTYSIYYN